MTAAKRLAHGGVMPNYQCTAACRHCLYGCSTDRSGGYMTLEAMEETSGVLREGGCRSVHIGGGEPFLYFDGLVELIQILNRSGIRVEYIETNAYWAEDRQKAEKQIQILERAGADTFCISVDPFHAEYVPHGLPLRLAAICRKAGFRYFLWQERFLSMMTRVDESRAHKRAELEKLISTDYIWETAGAYGLRMSGRAVNIEEEYRGRKPANELTDSGPCRNLLSTDHFHVDMHGKFIPPGCTGILIPLREVVKGIAPGRYPVFDALYDNGAAGLMEYAKELGFIENPGGYTSKCALCFHVRRWLSESGDHPELDGEYYRESLKHYKTIKL